VLVAVLDEDASLSGRDSVWMDAVGVIAVLTILWVLTSASAFRPALPALTALLLLGGLRGRISRAFLGWWPVYCIGAMCYTIYLYHFFVVSIAGKLFFAWMGPPDSTELAIAGFGLVATSCVILVCMIPYLLIERPFMIWRPGQNRLSDAFRFLLPAPRLAPTAPQ
jgi:peptidoglycan/LPS O-acetylase OafA/YrhL